MFHGSGATPRGGKEAYKSSGIPLVRSMNVYDMRFRDHELAFIDDTQARELDRVEIARGDVLLNITGASVARCCLAPEQVVGGRVNQHVMILRVDKEKADSGWLGRALAGPYKSGLLAIAGSGATREALTRSDVSRFRLSLPPLELQRKTARLMQVFEDLIENNRRRIEILEETARLLYQEWFVHLRYPGHEDVEFVESEMGPIPRGWAISRLADEIELRRKNFRPYEHEEEEFDHYSIPAFDANRRPSIDVGSDIRSGKYVLTGKSILVSKLNPRIPRTWRADPAMGHRRAVASTEFLVLTEPMRWPLAFIYGLVSSTEFMNALAATAGGTSTSHQRVKPADVMATAVLGPPVKLVEMYTEAVEPMLSLADILLRQVEVLREARDLLLPRLVSGELDISDLDLELEAVGV